MLCINIVSELFSIMELNMSLCKGFLFLSLYERLSNIFVSESVFLNTFPFKAASIYQSPFVSTTFDFMYHLQVNIISLFFLSYLIPHNCDTSSLRIKTPCSLSLASRLCVSLPLIPSNISKVFFSASAIARNKLFPSQVWRKPNEVISSPNNEYILARK